MMPILRFRILRAAAFVALGLKLLLAVLAQPTPDYVPIYPNTNQFTFSQRHLTIIDGVMLTNPIVNGVPWIGYSNGVVIADTSINPTDGYVPYRLGPTNFGDSPWYVRTNAEPALKEMGFGNTDRFIFKGPGGSIGLGTHVLLNAEGGNNTAVGYSAMSDAPGAGASVAVGYEALEFATNLTMSVGIGHRALRYRSGGANVAVGLGSMGNEPGTSSFNTAVGVGAMELHVSGDKNSAFGYWALASNSTGTENTAVGNAAGGTTGPMLPATFSYLAAVGSGAGAHLVTGDRNSLLGFYAGNTLTNGTDNTLVGSGADVTVGSLTNTIGIGAGVIVTNANDIVLGNSNNARLIVPIPSWSGIGTKYYADDGTFKPALSGLRTANIPYAVTSSNLAPGPIEVLDTNTVAVEIFDIGQLHITNEITAGSYLSLSGQTNRLTMAPDNLYFDGKPMGLLSFNVGQLTNSAGTITIINQPRITNAILSQVVTLGGLAYNFPTQHDGAGSVLIDYDNAGTLVWSGSITNPIKVYLTNSYMNGNPIATLGAGGVTNLFLPMATNGVLTSSPLNYIEAGGIGWKSTNYFINLANQNLGIGSNVLKNAMSGGYRNTAIGTESMSLLDWGEYNVGVGYHSLSGITNGDYNVAIGSSAGVQLKGGFYNTLLGDEAGDYVVMGNHNVAVGHTAGPAGDLSDTIAIGYQVKATNDADIVIGHAGIQADSYILGRTFRAPEAAGYTGTGTKVLTDNGGYQAVTAASVETFGADPTGVIDSSPALQAAADASTNLFVPSGKYLLSSPVTLRDNTSIHGAFLGPNLVGNFDGASGILKLGKNNHLQGLRFTATPGKTCFGIEASNPTMGGSLIEGCDLGYLDVGVWITNQCYGMKIRESWIRGCRVGVSWDGQSHLGYLTDCDLTGNGLSVYIDGCNHIMMKGCNFEYGTNYVVAKNCDRPQIIEPWTEMSDRSCFIFTNCNFALIRDGMITGAAYSTHTANSYGVEVLGSYHTILENVNFAGNESGDVLVATNALETTIRDFTTTRTNLNDSIINQSLSTVAYRTQDGALTFLSIPGMNAAVHLKDNAGANHNVYGYGGSLHLTSEGNIITEKPLSLAGNPLFNAGSVRFLGLNGFYDQGSFVGYYTGLPGADAPLVMAFGTNGNVTLAGPTYLRAAVNVMTIPFSAAVDQSGAVFANTGALSRVDCYLPTATPGVTYTFLLRNVVGFRIYPPAGATITLAGAITGVDGYIESATLGDGITITAINGTEWWSHPITGTGWAAH